MKKVTYHRFYRAVTVFYLTVIIMACTKQASMPSAYLGYTGNYDGYTLKLDERFDTFDNRFWVKGDGAVGSESSCRFQPQGVQVSDGLLTLSVRKEVVDAGWSTDHQANKPAYEFTCGEIRIRESKAIKYGRFETRLKAPQRQVASGYISSMFTYTNDGEPREWEEIDIELEGGRPDKFQANLIYGQSAPNWGATRAWGAWEHKIDISPADEWRVYAVEWSPTFIKWYVDGQLMKTLKQSDLDCRPNCTAPQKHPTPIPNNTTQLMMNFWIPNDDIQNVFGGNKQRNVYPMIAQYDWVRIYELDSHPFEKW